MKKINSIIFICGSVIFNHGLKMIDGDEEGYVFVILLASRAKDDKSLFTACRRV